ncbi:MAG: hypothetical protein PVG30_03570 [Gammaproteobacteria bacterium]|jgi:hypothetical protein
MFEISTSPQSIIGVLLNSIKLFKKTWLKLLPISVLMIGVVIFLIMFLPKQQMNLFAFKQQLNLSAVTQQVATKYLVTMLFSEAVMFWLFLVMFYRCYQIMIAANAGYKAAAVRALFKFLPCIIALFLYMIAVGFGTLCFVIPGIFLWILLVYNVLAILIDDKAIFASFAYSAKLVWGNWWRTLIVFLIFSILTMVLMLLIILIASLIFVNLFHMTVHNYTMAMNVVAVVLVVFMWIIFVNVFICQYYDLKLRRQLKTLR